jgi:hypothetical protein
VIENARVVLSGPDDGSGRAGDEPGGAEPVAESGRARRTRTRVPASV